MAPEQVRNRALTSQVDLYAVGVLLYECLTGENPFLGENAADTMVNHVTLAPDPPSKRQKDAEIPPYLDAVVMQALRKDPAERFPSAENFRWTLEGLVLARKQAATGGTHEALMTCPECGKVNIAGATLCDACNAPLEASRRLDRAAMNPELVSALEASSSGMARAEFDLAPTTTTVTAHRSQGWVPPLMGRDTEVEEIEKILKFGAPPYAQRFLRIVGAAGSGKARLARELLSRAEKDATKKWKSVWIEPEILSVFAPLHPIQGAAARLLNLVLPVDDASLIFDAATELGVGMQHREGLLELFGMPEDPNGPTVPRRAQRARAWREIVRIYNQKHALLLVFQDVHLYDRPSQELVATLVDADPCSHPMCIVATHDPSLLLLWGETRTLSLASLGREAAQALATHFLDYLSVGVETLGNAPGIAKLVELSGGNPLWVLELVRLCVVEGCASTPGGLAAVINQRIGHLPQRSRMMLHTMAVLGRPASIDTLVTMVPSQADFDEQALHFLSGAGFLTNDRAGWRFAHRLHREVAYVSTPAAIRQELHAKAAKVAVNESQPSSFIAHHAFRAGDTGLAVPALLRAGRSALHALDDTLAKELFVQVLRSIPAPPGEFAGRKPWLNATLGLAVACQDGGDSVTALRLLRRAITEATKAGWSKEAARCEARLQALRS